MTKQIKPWKGEDDKSLEENEEKHEEDVHPFGQVVTRRASSHLKELDQLKRINKLAMGSNTLAQIKG